MELTLIYFFQKKLPTYVNRKFRQDLLDDN